MTRQGIQRLLRTILVNPIHSGRGLDRRGRLRRQQSRFEHSRAHSPSTLTVADRPHCWQGSVDSGTPPGPMPASWRCFTPIGWPKLLATAGPARLAVSRRLGKSGWAIQEGLASSMPIGFPSPPFHCGMSDGCAVEAGNNAAWAGPGNLAKLTPIGQPSLLFVRTSGMEPSRTSATQPRHFKQGWRSSRPLASPACSLTRAGPTRTLPPAWQRRQGESRNLVELWPAGLPRGCCWPSPRPSTPLPSETAQSSWPRRRAGQRGALAVMYCNAKVETGWYHPEA